MIIVEQSVELLDTNKQGEKLIELAARNCYKSEDKITVDSHVDMIKRLKKFGHSAMFEFSWICIRVICDRAVSHQLVRHRHFSFAQESQHYIRYKGHLQFVAPSWVKLDKGLYGKRLDKHMAFVVKNHADWVWLTSMFDCEERYIDLTNNGGKAQEARALLPNSAKTEIVMAGNGRSWLEFFDKRLGNENTKEMSKLAEQIFDCMLMHFPTLFLMK
jgi:thymidylate synthase (FAD)